MATFEQLSELSPVTSLCLRPFWKHLLIIEFIMLSKISMAALASFLVSRVAAGPVNTNDHTPADKRSPIGISLPPLIPSIPGVTEPLASNAPPLPVLQLPTPPLDSPPFTGANIKPKKIGYFWTGAGDNIHKDFLVTASLDDV